MPVLPEFCCFLPPGLVPAVELPGVVWHRFCEQAANMALEHDLPVTLVGAVQMPDGGGEWLWIGAFCQHQCQYVHPGSVVALPDLLIAELVANGRELHDTDRLRDAKTGRSVWFYKVTT